VDAPSDSELRKYYEENKNLFTTPSRNRVSLILLRVDPSSSSEVWRQASDEATSIVERINTGADLQSWPGFIPVTSLPRMVVIWVLCI